MRIIDSKVPRIGCSHSMRCFRVVLWRVEKEYYCNKHFEFYCEANDFDPGKIVRLSDVDRDYEIIDNPNPTPITRDRVSA